MDKPTYTKLENMKLNNFSLNLEWSLFRKVLVALEFLKFLVTSVLVFFVLFFINLKKIRIIDRSIHLDFFFKTLF